MIIKGGKSILYMAAMILDFRKRSVLDSDPISKDDGIKIGVNIKKNHCVVNRNPYVKTEYFAIFNEGTEKYIEVIDNAIKQGILFKAGAFIKEPDENGEPKILKDGTKLQWQGMRKAKEYCIEHPEYFEHLKSQVNGEIETMSEEEIKETKKEMDEIDKVKDEIEDVIEETKTK